MNYQSTDRVRPTLLASACSPQYDRSGWVDLWVMTLPKCRMVLILISSPMIDSSSSMTELSASEQSGSYFRKLWQLRRLLVSMF